MTMLLVPLTESTTEGENMSRRRRNSAAWLLYWYYGHQAWAIVLPVIGESQFRGTSIATDATSIFDGNSSKDRGALGTKSREPSTNIFEFMKIIPASPRIHLYRLRI